MIKAVLETFLHYFLGNVNYLAWPDPRSMSIPPKYAVAQIIGFIKGKSAIQIARNFVGRKKNFTGQHFWARGYHVSTVGRDEDAIRKYIKEQEKEDRRIDQLNLFDE